MTRGATCGPCVGDDLHNHTTPTQGSVFFTYLKLPDSHTIDVRGSTQCSVHNAPYTVLSTQCSVHSAPYTVLSTQCSVHSASYPILHTCSPASYCLHLHSSVSPRESSSVKVYKYIEISTSFLPWLYRTPKTQQIARLNFCSIHWKNFTKKSVRRQVKCKMLPLNLQNDTCRVTENHHSFLCY